MSLETYYKDHWIEIEPARLERYEAMFRWNEGQEPLLADARIAAGQVVVDFGCGPGHLAMELLKRVGGEGHVHALDVNADFLARTRGKAAEAGLPGGFSLHPLTDTTIPLPDACVDRIIAKNVLVYVDEPAATFREFRRILKPGGLVHAIDSDFWMAVVDPVPPALWRAFIDAADHAFRTPTIGRHLYRYAKEAGFPRVGVRVVARPDTTGRWMNFVNNAAGYARLGGQLPEADIQAVQDMAQAALDEGCFFAVNPQFVVTAEI